MNKKFAHMMAWIVMFLWGMSYLSIKVVVKEIDPILSAFYRYLVAAIILYISLKIKFPEEKILKKDRGKMALGGLFGISLYFTFENLAVSYTTASNVSVLIASIPIFTIVSQRIVFGEKFTLRKILGTTLSLIGIVIIVSSKGKVSLFSKGTIGDLMALGAALSWVMYNIVNSKVEGEYKSITVTTYQAIWGCIFLSPSLLVANLQMPSMKVALNLLYLAIFCSCIGFAIYIYCLEKLGATVITTYVNLQPMITLVTAALILKESITIWQGMGSVIILAGVFLVSFSGKKKIVDRQQRRADYNI
ncbi:DMT family transporter [Clostridium ganghwense]|uniref:DMT family transporter n=1 Tax=Clostridium ganghwense TaxID=312089 RepID=A0ABT4CPC0_9CLOT|nr:DMT family transporter [Clostridium ganghwense]MCY6370872.1 DMT family transporter [Clostridium ganghwense]